MVFFPFEKQKFVSPQDILKEEKWKTWKIWKHIYGQKSLKNHPVNTAYIIIALETVQPRRLGRTRKP